MKIKWELKGAKELRKMFDNKRALRLLIDPMNKAVNLVVRDAVKDAPHKTGHMRRNIHGKPAKVEGSKIIGIVGSKVHYTPYQEFGTKYIKAKYFMTNALKNNINIIVGMFKRTIDKIFK